MDHSIKINKDKILAFKLHINQEIVNEIDKVELIINDIIEKDKTIEIKAEYFFEQKKNSLEINYLKDSLNPYDLLFIGWSYLSIYEKREFTENKQFKSKAKEYLIQSIKKDIKSCLPHYLLADYPLEYIEGINSMEDLYFALDVYDDDFPDFYSLLYIKEKNKIKGLGVLKKGLEKFSTSFILNYHISNYLIEIKNFDKALGYLEKANMDEYENYGIRYLSDLFYNMFISYVNIKNFKNAEKFLDSKVVFDDDQILLLKGLFYYYKSDFDSASNFFLEYIHKNLYLFSGFCSYYFLLDCYLKLKKFDLLSDILNAIPDTQIDYVDYNLDIKFLEVAENSLKEITKLDLDEIMIARAKGILASIMLYERLPKFIDEPKRVLTKKEKDILEKSESLIKDAISFYPINHFFLEIYSDILFLKERFNESMIAKIKSLENKIYGEDPNDYTYISLMDCSGEFIDNYKNELEKILLRKNLLKNTYINHQLSSDIDNLFELKKYNAITDLYFYFKKNLNLNEFDSLFEIAYSLKEMDYIDESEFIYSKILEIESENSSVLNNLAIILEAKGKLNKAIYLIKKAKKLNKTDSIIDNNLKRLTNKTETKRESKKETKSDKKQKLKLTFNSERSQIIYGNKFCDIPINTYEYYLCKIIFEKSLGTKIQEDDIFSFFDSVKLEEHKRSVYDAVIRINKKVEAKFGLKKILINRRALVWIREDILGI